MTKSKFIGRVAAIAATLIATLGIGLGLSNRNVPDDTGKSTDIEQPGGELQIHYMDVGQGDATLIVCDGHAMLIDAGENDKGSSVWSYLKSQGIEELDYVIGTHPDSDHIGGLDVIIYKFQCGKVFMPDLVKDTRTYEDVIKAAENKNYKITVPKVGEKYTLGGAEFTVIAPNDNYKDANNASIGILLTYGGTSFLFTGDAEEEAEKDIIENGINIDADVYKAGHHGSRTSSCDEFLAEVTPEYVVISCGENNSYGHPHAAIINYCISNNIPIYRTDMQGTIVLKSDGSNITWNMSPYEY